MFSGSFGFIRLTSLLLFYRLYGIMVYNNENQERSSMMSLTRKMLPIGVENFEKLRRNDMYYVDKTEIIADLLRNHGDANLFTRPRRFGKTLTMDTLKTFFEIGQDASLFDGLAISRHSDICEKHQNKYPVVFISLKGAAGMNL